MFPIKKGTNRRPKGGQWVINMQNYSVSDTNYNAEQQFTAFWTKTAVFIWGVATGWHELEEKQALDERCEALNPLDTQFRCISVLSHIHQGPKHTQVWEHTHTHTHVSS